MAVRETVQQVLAEVAEHHEWQHETYGNVNRPMPDGTGPDAEWLAPVLGALMADVHIPARSIEAMFRSEWDYPKDGTPEEQDEAARSCTWLRLLREEFAEAAAAEDSKALENELIQAAAVAVSWVAVIRERNQA